MTSNRDTRRAEAAGFELSEDEWRAPAELGRDAVSEEVKERREAELQRLKGQRDELIRRGQQAERDKRRAVIEEAVKRRAEKRVADSRPPMKLGPTF